MVESAAVFPGLEFVFEVVDILGFDLELKSQVSILEKGEDIGHSANQLTHLLVLRPRPPPDGVVGIRAWATSTAALRWKFCSNDGDQQV